MRSPFAVLTKLIIPAGAPPGSPSIAIGGAGIIPADLQAFYTGLGFPVIGGIILRTSATIYVYYAQLSNGGGHVVGASNAGNVAEAYAVGSLAGVARMFFGLTSAINIQIGANGSPTGSTFDIEGASCDFQVDSVSAPRGYRTRIDSNSGTAAAGAEAVALTSANMTFRAGRAYAIRWGTDQVSSVANVVAFRVRRTGIAGTVLSLSQFPVPTGAGAQHRKTDQFYVANFTGADVTDILVLTHQPSAGTTTGIGSATQVRYLEVEDVGAAAAFVNAFAIV